MKESRRPGARSRTLVLLDIHMPRMDGYEVARHLGADPECSQIPIVAVTALAMVGDREKILASGFSGYIAKPLDPEFFPHKSRHTWERRMGASPASALACALAATNSHCDLAPLKK